MENTLIKIGFSINEAKVYTSLIKLGQANVGLIAAKSGVHRTNVYDVLSRLIERGLVSYIYKKGKKYFNAEDPTKILDILKEKESLFQKALAAFISNFNTSKTKDKAQIYEGVSGLKTILNDILNTKEDVVTFGVPKDIATSSKKMKNFIASYHRKRILNKIKQYHIYDENAMQRINFLNKMPYTKAKYLPRNENSPATTTVYGNKIVFFIWSEPILSILIESERMAQAYRNYFKLLWNISKK